MYDYKIKPEPAAARLSDDTTPMTTKIPDGPDCVRPICRTTQKNYTQEKSDFGEKMSIKAKQSK